MLSEEELREFESLIEELREENKNSPVLVEGKHDERALRNLGLRGEIIKLNEGKSVVNFAEKIASRYSTIILLFDWDERGRKLTGEIASLLREMNVEVNLEFWVKIQGMIPHVSSVEELRV